MPSLDHHLIQHLLMLTQRLQPKRVGRHHATRRHSRDTDAWKHRISTQQELLNRSSRSRENRLTGLDGGTVAAAVASKEALVSKGGADHGNITALPDVGDDSLDRLPQNLAPLLLEFLILIALPVQTLPQVIRLSSWSVGMDAVKPLRSHVRIKHRRDGHEHQVLLTVHAGLPIVDYHVMTLKILPPHRLLEPLGVKPEVQMHEGAALRHLIHLLAPRCRHVTLWQQPCSASRSSV
mmetsp:Transcript_37325/g.72880  ORF Transcript_37325/g.72880 Transcript_37325/m.72880 type:complete len:236 (-) Transcript_37325:34-741(-)